MARASRSTLIVDTGHFTPVQLQPRSLLQIAFNEMSRWLGAHLVPFPALIHEHHHSVVILAADVDYRAPLRFAEAAAIDVLSTFRVRREGTRAELMVSFAARGTTVADVRIVLCPVAILEPTSLAATPAAFGPQLMARFAADELVAGSPERRVGDVRAKAEAEPALVQGRAHPFVVHRHLCEVADQWAFYEVPGLVGASREALVMSDRTDAAPLRPTLGRPLRQVSFELYRPYYWLQRGAIHTAAHPVDGGVAFVHRLTAEVPGEPDHGTVVELF